MDTDDCTTRRGSRRKSSGLFHATPAATCDAAIGSGKGTEVGDIFQELFSRLFANGDKPEDPIRWIQDYLCQTAPSRQVKLESLIEALQEDILQKAYEIKEARESRRFSAKYKRNASEGPEQRCHIEPNPLFRLTLNLAEALVNRRHKDISTEDDKVNDPSRFRSLNLGEGRSTTSTGGLAGTNDVDKEESDSEGQEFSQYKSTETSPQGSSHEINAVGSSGSFQTTEFQPQPPTNRIQYKIYDPRFFAEHIPLGFWKEDFSLDKSESESDSEDNLNSERLIGPNLEFRLPEQPSWCPEPDVEVPSTLEDAESARSSLASATPPTPSTASHPPSLEQLKRNAAHCEWIHKTYGSNLLNEIESYLIEKRSNC